MTSEHQRLVLLFDAKKQISGLRSNATADLDESSLVVSDSSDHNKDIIITFDDDSEVIEIKVSNKIVRDAGVKFFTPCALRLGWDYEEQKAQFGSAPIDNPVLIQNGQNLDNLLSELRRCSVVHSENNEINRLYKALANKECQSENGLIINLHLDEALKMLYPATDECDLFDLSPVSHLEYLTERQCPNFVPGSYFSKISGECQSLGIDFSSLVTPVRMEGGYCKVSSDNISKIHSLVSTFIGWLAA